LAWCADGEAACDAWRSAVGAFETAHMPVEAARARVRLAGAALAAGDRATAAAAVEQAEPVLREVGALPDLDALESVARRGRLRVIVAERVGVGGNASAYGLTERELEVLALVADGLTNKEIAAELFISAKTASVHVSNVMRKLGVTNRREAGRVAAELGLGSFGRSRARSR
jgi:DNA-binding CsgD family transcriptional regulator